MISKTLKIPGFSPVFLLPAILAMQAITATPDSARDIVAKADEKMRGKSSFSRLRMEIKRSRIDRSLEIDAWENKGGKKYFIRILSPKKDKGVTFLKIDQNLWQYIPKIGKEIKIETSLLQNSWMGSDFTNDDLVKQSSIIEDFEHSFIAETNGVEFRIELTPKPDAPIVWKKIIVNIRKADLLFSSQEFYNHKGEMVKRQVFGDFRVMGGRFIPCRMVMSTLKNGKELSRTVMRFEKMEFDLAIPDGIFSTANLRKSR